MKNILPVFSLLAFSLNLAAVPARAEATPAAEASPAVESAAPSDVAPGGTKNDAPKKKAEAGKSGAKKPEEKPADKAAASAKGNTAIIRTDAGDITIKLFADRAPKTVENFVSLATGKKEWTDPTTGKKVKKPLYNGTIFHRIVPGFVIQGGDPLGTGFGGPGYTFEDETKPSDKFDKEGLVAMANAGPNTNGSQFFITVAPVGLPPNYTIFGEVTSGMDVVQKIVSGERGPNDRPKKPVTMKKIDIR